MFQKQEMTSYLKEFVMEKQKIVKQYFDLNRDYEKIKETLSKIDKNMKTSIEYGKRNKILNQDLWKQLYLFIISANNNIPRIQRDNRKII